MIYNSIFLQSGGGSLAQMLPFLAMFLVIYLFMIRPQIKRQKNEKSFQSTLSKGTKIVTTSGIHGKIIEINNDNTVMVETNAGKIKFERSAISMELSKRYSVIEKK